MIHQGKLEFHITFFILNRHDYIHFINILYSLYFVAITNNVVKFSRYFKTSIKLKCINFTEIMRSDKNIIRLKQKTHDLQGNDFIKIHNSIY